MRHLLLAIVLIACARIALTWRVFSPTYDEPVHVAAGYDYLKQHTFLDKQHPPLAKALFGLPFVGDPPPDPAPDSDLWIRRGNSLLYHRGHYLRGIAESRAGNLLFVIAAIVALYAWARRLFGERVALIAAAIFSFLPPVLAHGGLATTDMAGTAALAVAMLALDRLLEQPSWPRTMALAAAIAFGTLSKFSFPLFFLVCAAIACVARRRAPFVKFAAAVAAAFVVVWAVYFFSFGTIASADPKAGEWSTELFHSTRFVEQVPLPAPALFAGLLELARHNHIGHQTFLLGRYADRGWWYYFPVVLAVKTPIPLLLGAIAGAVLAFRRRAHPELAFMALAILAVAMTSRINLGVRHILPIYLPLSMLAALAAAEVRTRWIAIALAAWLAIGSLLAHPDYLPWMNAFAGRHPERVLADSNFDWGQDLIRLRIECRKRHIQRMGALLVASAAGDMLGLPLMEPNPVDKTTPTHGWVVAAETPINLEQAYDPHAYEWLTKGRGFVRVGKTLRLYFVQ